MQRRENMSDFLNKIRCVENRIPVKKQILVFICGVVVLRRTTIKETIVTAAIGIVLAIVINIVIPFRF